MIWQRTKDFLKLIRWFHELFAVFPFIALYLIIRYYAERSGLTCSLSGFDFFMLCFSVQLLIAAGCVLNDIMDRHIDKINKPQTYTVGRTISLQNAWRIFAILTLLIIVLSLYISVYMFGEWAFISLAVYVASILYDVYLKRSPLFGNILIACMASFVPLVLFFFAGDCIDALNDPKINNLIYLYCFFPFLVIIPRELSLDISDMKGDKADGCKTLPIVIGEEKARYVVIGCILFMIALSFLLAYKLPYLRLALAGIGLGLIYYIYLFGLSKTRPDLIKAGRFLWFVLIAGLIALTVSTVW